MDAASGGVPAVPVPDDAGMSLQTSILEVVEFGEKVESADAHVVPTSAVPSPGGVCSLDSENTSCSPSSVDLSVEELRVAGLPRGSSKASSVAVGARECSVDASNRGGPAVPVPEFARVPRMRRRVRCTSKSACCDAKPDAFSFISLGVTAFGSFECGMADARLEDMAPRIPESHKNVCSKPPTLADSGDEFRDCFEGCALSGGGVSRAPHDSQGVDSGVVLIEQLDANDVSPPAMGEVTSAEDDVIGPGLRAEVCKPEFCRFACNCPPLKFRIPLPVTYCMVVVRALVVVIAMCHAQEFR